MKYTLMVFNLIVLGIGGAVLGLGIYVLVADYGVTKLTIIFGADGLYKTGAILLIVLGSVTILISFCGCCGAWRENRVLLGLYFIIMLLLLIFYVAGTVVGFVFRDNITSHLKREAENSIVNKYGNSVDREVTARWDAIQQGLKCCGLTGGQNSSQSWAIYKNESQWFRTLDYEDKDLGVKYVPASCCKPDVNLEICVGRSPANSTNPPARGPPVAESMTFPDGLYTNGCYDQMENFLRDNAAIIGGIALAALCIMLLGVIFSVALCTQIGKAGYVV